MNKLYIIRFKLTNGFVVSTWWAWNESDALDKIQKNPEWRFSVVTDNDTRKIWDAR